MLEDNNFVDRTVYFYSTHSSSSQTHNTHTLSVPVGCDKDSSSSSSRCSSCRAGRGGDGGLGWAGRSVLSLYSSTRPL